MESIKYNPNPPDGDLARYAYEEFQRIRDSFNSQSESLYEFITPVSTQVITGGTPVGSVTDVQTLKDGNYYQVPEVSGTPGFDIRFNFTNVKSIAGFVSMIRYTGSTTHDVTLRILNYSTVAQDAFLVIPHTATLDAYRTVLIPDDANYINSSRQAQMTLYHDSQGNPSHDIYIDYIALLGTTYVR